MEPADPYPAATAAIPAPDGTLAAWAAAIPDWPILLSILLAAPVLLALLLGFETAFFTLRGPALAATDTGAAARLRRTPTRLFATVILYNVLLQAATALAAAGLGARLAAQGVMPLAAAVPLGLLATVGLVVLAHAASHVAYRSAQVPLLIQWVAPLLLGLQWLLWPLVWLVAHAVAAFQPKAAAEAASPAAPNADDDTQTLPDPPDILHALVALNNSTVRSILQPRVEVRALDIAWPLEEVLRRVAEYGYSRLPVYEENADRIRGIVYTKDLLPLLNGERNLSWTSLVRPCLFVPETKRIHLMLAEFKEKRQHMAIVIDEFGGVAGVVTLQDILEEIFGDISDELDHEKPPYERLSADMFVFEGRTHLDEVARAMNLPEGTFEDLQREHESLAGLVISLLESLPQEGAQVRYGDFRLTAEQVSETAVQRVRVERLKPRPASDPVRANRAARALGW